MSEPMRPVLVASDLQASSRPVVEYAARLARAAGAPLFLFHVVERKTGHIPRNIRESQLERSRRNGERALQLQAARLEEAGTRVTLGQVVDRPAHTAILERIRDIGAGIVVVGSGARKGRGHRLGSTADRLLRSSPVPCLIVRGQADLPITKAAAATDFSSQSRLAFRTAAPWLAFLGEGRAGLELLHAASQAYFEIDPSLEDLLEKKLNDEIERLGDVPGVVSMEGRLSFGRHPVDQILEEAGERGYQLLVAGTHGHGPVRRALIGSVALGLAQSAPCPVLIVPPRASR